MLLSCSNISKSKKYCKTDCYTHHLHPIRRREEVGPDNLPSSTAFLNPNSTSIASTCNQPAFMSASPNLNNPQSPFVITSTGIAGSSLPSKSIPPLVYTAELDLGRSDAVWIRYPGKSFKKTACWFPGNRVQNPIVAQFASYLHTKTFPDFYIHGKVPEGMVLVEMLCIPKGLLNDCYTQKRAPSLVGTSFQKPKGTPPTKVDNKNFLVSTLNILNLLIYYKFNRTIMIPI